MEEVKAHLILDRKSFSVLRRGTLADGDLLTRTKFNYAAEVGTGLSSALIVAVVRWVARAFAEAPLAIRDPEWELQYKHRLLDLWRAPNPWYGERILRAALAVDYTLNGNAYLWISERDGAKRPTQLVYMPYGQITPKGTEAQLITHYERGGVREPIPLADMIHFRQGLDPLDMKLGLSPLRALLREIFTDDEAANFTASVMRNMGFAGVVVQPESEDDHFGPKARERFKRYFRRMFRGDLRGEVLVTSARVKIGQQEIDLSKLDLGALRDIPEERVTAVTGVPAAVVGFGSGLQQTKVGATLEELRKLAYNNAIIPMQTDMTEELTRRLLPEFEARDGYAVVFDNSEVQALQEDANKRADRYGRLYTAGVITRGLALRALGEEATEADEVYRTSVADVFVRAGDMPEPQTEEEDVPEELMAQRAYPPTKSAAGLRRQRLDRRLLADFRTLSRKWAGELRAHFDALGEELSRAWVAEQKVYAGGNGRKADPESIDMEDRRIIESLLLAHRPELPDFGPVYLRIARRTVAGIETVMGLGVMLDDPLEREILQLGGTRRGLIDMEGETREALFKALAAAREEGLGVDATARRIRDGIASGPWADVRTRATVIARTETKYAQNASSMEVYSRAENVTGIQIFDAQLGDTDEPCLQANGKIVPIAEAASIEMLLHPNCFPGSTVVMAPQLTGTFARYFEGELIVLRTAEDQLLSCTPNHPILTDRGWRAAGMLREGEYVISCRDHQGIAGLFNDDQMPTSIEDVARAFRVSCDVTASTMPGATPQFHGDGFESEISVVRANRTLEVSDTEHAAESARERADAQLSTLARSGALDLLGRTVFPPSRGFMSGSRQAQSLGWGSTGHVQGLRLRQRSEFVPVRVKGFAERGRRHSEGRGDLISAFAGDVAPIQTGVVSRGVAQRTRVATIEQVTSERSISDANTSSDILQRFAGLVSLVKVIEIRRRPFAGHVFNLQTVQGWYIAEGLCVHNCTRSVAPVVG